MLTNNTNKAIKRHTDQGHEVIERPNQFNGEPEYKCVDCDLVLAWQVPEFLVSMDQQYAITIGLAMRLDLDSDSIDHLLLQGGYNQVTEENYSSAVEYVRENAPPLPPRW